jgi:capsular polysaccharide biosynthesis protein
MELFEALDFINKNKKSIFLITLLFGLIGVGTYFFLPKKYTATGSFYVQRSTENSSGKYFTYEGYYSQQTALAYANTFIGFLESDNTRKNALQNLNISATEQNLRALGRQINVKKSAPQIITLTVKDNSSTAAAKLWSFIATDNLTAAKELNQTGDAALQIEQIGDPVVKEQYSNLFINALAGLGTGFLIGVFATAFAQYRKEAKKA